MSANIRTFRAKDARSALAAVRAALGGDAIILSTREVGGGLFRAPELEVTAAKHEELAPAAPSPAPEPVATRYPAPRNAARPAEPAAPAPTPPAARETSHRDELSEELVALRGTVEQLRRQMVATSKREALEHGLNLPASAVDLFGRLCTQGVEEQLAEDLVRRAVEQCKDLRPETVLGHTRALMSEMLMGDRAPWVKGRQRAVALVGPTGVGKTTTLAKIAARAVMDGQKVSLITVDTYRIGASDQVARYGKIMGAPTFVARNRDELSKAIERCVQADLILIDTAGRSVSEAVARQAELIRTVPQVQLYLVASAATGCRELATVADRYRALGPSRLIFTKLDEASGPGSILSATVRVGRPVAAVADGQRVPEDIHSFESDQLVELVLGHIGGDRQQAGVSGRQ